MPSFFIPARSSRHRTACIALYRALLQQCERIALPDEVQRGSISPIKHHVRKAFRRNKNDTSPRLVVTALKIGYEIESLLRHAAHGDPASHSRILSLLNDIQARSIKPTTSPAHPSSLARNPVTQPRPKHTIPAPHPSAKSLLASRPIPKERLSGRRHVPVLVNANGVPYLRIKKLQSAYLSRVIRDKIATKQKRTDRMEDLAVLAEWGAEEERWESHLRAHTDYGNGLPLPPPPQPQQQTRHVAFYNGRNSGGSGRSGVEDVRRKMTGEGRWDDEAIRARQMVLGRIDAQNKRNAAIARKMLWIVDRETELAVEERRARKRGGERTRKRRRKSERAGAAAGKAAGKEAAL